MSRVLLTGATGFVGREALTALDRAGHEVHAVARRPPPGTGAVRWHAGDLVGDADSAGRVITAARPEVLLHLAWYAEHGRFWAAPENLDWVAATLRLLREFAGSGGGRRVVVAGSCAEYAWTRSVYAEGDLCAPATLYGAAKHSLHLAAEAFAAACGLSLVWGRLFFLYGPGEAPERFVSTIIRRLLAGEAAPMTSGYQIRDFLHVADAGDALATLAGGQVDGAVNVASGVGVSLRDLAGLIAKQVGGTGRLELGAIPERSEEPASLVADVSRLHTVAGWRPRIGLGEGIARTVDGWRGG